MGNKKILTDWLSEEKLNFLEFRFVDCNQFWFIFSIKEITSFNVNVSLVSLYCPCIPFIEGKALRFESDSYEDSIRIVTKFSQIVLSHENERAYHYYADDAYDLWTKDRKGVLSENKCNARIL